MSTAEQTQTAVSPEHILQVGWIWGSRTLLSAVELGLFTELATRPATADELRTRLALHPRSSRDFFDALVSLGLLERTDGVYTNTAATDLFLDRKSRRISAACSRCAAAGSTVSGTA